MRVGEDGWLVSADGGAPVLHLPSTRTRALGPAGALGLVWHATGGTGGPGGAERLARRIQAYRPGVDRPASWNLLVGRDGTVYQSASMLVGTWHTGRPGVVAGRRHRNVNTATIGVELQNAGQLRSIAGQAYAWPFWRDVVGRRLPDPRCAVPAGNVEQYDGAPHDGFPTAQVRAAVEIVDALKTFFGWRREAASYGHAIFAAPSKIDPGRLWMEQRLPRILDEVFGPGLAGEGRV